jgi:hypothetical protein
MKKINNRVKQHRSFRRFVRQLFSNWMRHQSFDHQEEMKKMHARLQGIENTIEKITREMARQLKD